MLSADLKVIGGRQNGKLIPLPKKFLIGREQDCHLRPNSDLVSRHHCAFTLDEYTLRLRDLGSTNGTFVNGERLTGEAVLKQGDQVRVGKLDFEIQLRDVNSPQVPVEDQFLAEDDSRVMNPGDPGPASSETMVDVRLPSSQPDEFSESDTGTIPTYQPPAGYPPGMPPGGYYPMPPGYYPPQGMPGYPMPPGYPGYYPPMPQAPPAVAPPPAPQPPSAAELPAVRLPDPKETGIKESPAAPAGGQGPATPAKGKESINAAADLLNKMRERR